MSIVVCKLPKAGLGNQLFPLMKAIAFARLNNLPLTITHYHQLKIGPYLRREKTKRKYRGYFSFQKSIVGERIERWKLQRYKAYETENEPPVKSIVDSRVSRKKYFFSKLPHYHNYFDQLKENRELVIELFYKTVSPAVLQRSASQATPCIGVHIRMGDFRKMMEGEDFSQLSSVRTPEAYFIHIIEGIRRINGNNLPVSVFTDGYKSEFTELFKVGNINIVEGNSDIVDLLLLAKSKIILVSAGSTFSYWAGFLSTVPLIMHPQHIFEPVRPAAFSNAVYEGAFNENDPLLIKNIKAIRC